MTVRPLLAIPTLALLIAACADKAPDSVSRDSAAPPQTTSSQPAVSDGGDSTARVRSAVNAGYDTLFPKDAADPATRTDTADGTLTVKGSGAREGTWKMFDATATLAEDVRAGSTVTTLSIEGHRGMPEATVALRLTSDGPINPGRYGIGQAASPVRVDARWDLDGTMYRALNGTTATGWVEITSMSNNRVRGSYNLTLPPLDGGGPAQTVSGDIDQEILVKK